MWITITPEKVRGSMADCEFAAFASDALVPGGSDPVTQAIATVTAQIAGAVGASGRNMVGEPGTVPPELESEALIMIMESLSSRLPGSSLVWDEVRTNRLEEAVATLTEIRNGEYLVTEPGGAPPQDGGCFGNAGTNISGESRVIYYK